MTLYLISSIPRRKIGHFRAVIGKGYPSHRKLKEQNILSLFGRGPDSYSALAILRYVYSMHSRLHSFFSF